MSISKLPIVLINYILKQINIPQRIQFSMTCKLYYEKCFPNRNELGKYLTKKYQYNNKILDMYGGNREVCRDCYDYSELCYVCEKRNSGYCNDTTTCTQCDNSICNNVTCKTIDDICMECINKYTNKCKRCYNTDIIKRKCSMCDISMCDKCVNDKLGIKCCYELICTECQIILNYCKICKVTKCMEENCHKECVLLLKQ